MTLQAYIYVRFSDPKQDRGSSRERQINECTALCQKNGWQIVDYVQDLGRSAWKGVHLESGELGKFAEKVREGVIPPHGTILVAEKLDRFSRQGHRTAQRWMEDLCELGLTIATAEGGRVYTDQNLRDNLMPVIEILMAAKLAQDESDRKSVRVRAALRRKETAARTSGTVITAKAPGWLSVKADRSGFNLRDDRVDLVQQMYQMASEGKGPRLIAAILNERGIAAWGKPTEKNPSPKWELSSVRNILMQPAVEGDYVPGFANTDKDTKSTQPPILGYYPRIIDAELVEQARASLASRKIDRAKDGQFRTGGRYTRNVASLFAGMVFCGSCGGRMHLRANGGVNPSKRWQCHSATVRRGCQQTEMFRYREFEKAALDEILHLALDDRYFATPGQAGALASKVAEIDKTLRDRTGAVSRLIRNLANYADMPDVERQMRVELEVMNAAILELKAQRENAANALASARGAVSPSEHIERVREVRGALDDADLEVRRAARSRVLTALRGLGVKVNCDLSAKKRQMTMVVADGGLAVTIGNDGSIIGRYDILGTVDRRLKDKSPEEVAEVVDKLLRNLAIQVLNPTGDDLRKLKAPSTTLQTSLATSVKRRRSNTPAKP